LVKRNWGSGNITSVNFKKISLKKLIINKGKGGGLQYHRKKNECGYILSGKLKITYVDKKKKLAKYNFKKR